MLKFTNRSLSRKIFACRSLTVLAYIRCIGRFLGHLGSAEYFEVLVECDSMNSKYTFSQLFSPFFVLVVVDRCHIDDKSTWRKNDDDIP